MPKKIIQFAALLVAVFCFKPALSQQSNLTCSQTNVPLVNNTTPSFTVTQSVLTTGSGGWTNAANVVDNNLSNYATGGFLVTAGTVTLRVSDGVNTYNAGNFAGFVVANPALSVNALGALTLRTYLNGTLQETKSGGALLGVGSSLISGALEVGFYTNKPFNAVEITAASTVGLSGYNVYYAILEGTGSCTSPALFCNAAISPAFPVFAAVVDPEFTGASGGVTVASVANTGNAVDNSTTTYASITTTASAAGSAFLAVKDVTTDYPAGTYAGFDIENPALANIALLSNVLIRTYKDGVAQEQQSGTGLGVGASAGSNGSRQRAGFVTTLPFDEVQLVINQPAVGADLGETRVYGAVLKKLCAGPALVCNTPVQLNEALYPVYITLDKTGTAGGACANCRVDSTGNLIDGNSGTAATINLTAGAVGTGSISVKNALTTYSSGTYVGFDIESAALLNTSALSNFTVSTYQSGSLKESFTGATLLAGVSTSLLGTSGRLTIGNLTTQPFDEVRLTADQTASVSLGITKVYGVSLVNFCDTVLTCANPTYWLNNPTFPVFVDALHTGVTGAACAACNVTDAGNVLTSSLTDYAVLTPVAGVAASASISVHDALKTYPAGTVAGFAIADLNNLVGADLFRAITITTYNNGVFQESRSAGQLLNLSALILQVNPGAGYYNIGFTTTQPFDEIRISTTPLAGVLPIIRVYGAYIDTRYLNGTTLGIVCTRPPVAEPDHVTTITGIAVTSDLSTNDRDPQGQALTYNTTAAVQPLHGTVTISASGVFTYTPAAGYSGVDSFQYTVCNTSTYCVNQWAYISVLPAQTPGGANKPPVVQPDFSQTFINTPVSGNAQSNDNDPDGNALTYTVTTPPLHGTLTLSPNGQYTYAPDSSYVGLDSAVLNVCDNGTPGMCRTSNLKLEVLPDRNGSGNNPPFAQDDNVTTAINRYVSGNVLNNDSDPNGDPITATVLDAVDPAKGTLYATSNGGFTFVPANNFTGNVVTRYQVCDNGTPSLCDTASLTISVAPVTGPDYTPVVVFDSTTFSTPGVARDFVVQINSLNSSPSNSPLIFKVLKPSAFTVSYSQTTTVSVVNGATAVSNSNWTFTEDDAFVTCQLNAGVVLAGNSQTSIGFSLTRKASIAPATQQNITVTIVTGSGGDSNKANNQSTGNITAR